MNRPKIITGPHDEPLTLAEAKAHCRVDDSYSDSLISALIQAARESAELYTERSFVQRSYRLTLDAFPQNREAILLPYPPVVGVTQIQYFDTDGALQTWSSGEYHVDEASEPGRVMPNSDQSYPSDVDYRAGAVRVEYVAGYPEDETGSPTDYVGNVPQLAKQAMLMMVGEWFMNREDTVVGNIIGNIPEPSKAWLWQYKVFR